MLLCQPERRKIMNYKFKTKPYAHQMTALEKSWNKETYAYFMEMGTGKTKVLIDNLAMLYDKGKVNGALIIAPKGVVGTWYTNELPTHLPDHIENVTVLWQPNITKKQQESLDTLFQEGEGLHILIMNVEAFSTDKGRLFAGKFLSCHNTMMAIDESTTIKNPSAKRTKNILALGNIFSSMNLTALPISEDILSNCVANANNARPANPTFAVVDFGVRALKRPPNISFKLESIPGPFDFSGSIRLLFLS
jgi:hypothetical protein